jgi:hypothetical protein
MVEEKRQGEDMKVALVLTGLMRGWKKAYPSFKQYVLDRYETDVYIDTWSEVGWYTGKSYLPETPEGFVKLAEGDKGFHPSGELIDASKILDVYKPVSFYIDDFSRFEYQIELISNQFERAFTRPKNTVAQAFKVINGVAQLAANSDNSYDVVVRARPDIVLEHDPGQFNPDVFLTLPSRNKRGRGTGDSIQIGSATNIQLYAEMFYELESLYATIGYSCPHEFASSWITRNHLPWHEMSVGAHITHSPSGQAYQEPD